MSIVWAPLEQAFTAGFHSSRSKFVRYEVLERNDSLDNDAECMCGNRRGVEVGWVEGCR